MITIESDRTADSIQTIVRDVLGQDVPLTQAGRLGYELNFAGIDRADLDALRKALRRGGHRVYTTRIRVDEQ